MKGSFLDIVVSLILLFQKFFRFKKVANLREKETFNNIWYPIWKEEKYYAYEDQPLVQQFAKYDAYSYDYLLIFIIWPIATLKLIVENEDIQLPLISDFKINKFWGSKKVAEVTLFALKKQFRGYYHLFSLMLMKMLRVVAKNSGVDGVVMECDKRLFFLLNKLGFVMHKIGQERYFEGSIVYPSYLEFEETVQHLKACKSPLYKFFR
ncbi:MAG: hypothetical protein NT116_00895 [Candidatus Parcubacteria bacterium]|nr:hypothetical protein [Candidatus Parcubacteria bacterium]